MNRVARFHDAKRMIENGIAKMRVIIDKILLLLFFVVVVDLNVDVESLGWGEEEAVVLCE